MAIGAKPVARVRFLTFHCSAHPRGRAVTVAQMNAIAARKFGQRSYHWIITLDGVAHRNLPDNVRGAHVGRNNTGNIGIVYVGGLEANMSPADTRTDAQKATMRRMRDEYRRLYPGIVVRGHRDWSPDLNRNGKVDKVEWLKACPCFDVATEL